MTKPEVGTDFQRVLESSKNTITTLQRERDKPVSDLPRNLVFGGLFLGVIAFVGMIGLQILTGLAVLALTAVFAIVSILGIRHGRKLDALIAQKIKNYALERQLEEARNNNIVQLKNILLNRQARLDQGYQARAEMKGYLNKMKMKIDQSDETDTYYKQKVDMYNKVKSAFDTNGIVLEKAKISVQEFSKQILHYEGMKEFTEIAGKAMAALDNDHLEEMLSLEAFNSIETNFCTAMAELETSIEMADI